MSRLKYLVLALGALAFASLIAVSGPSKTVQAQTPPDPIGAGSLVVEKLCLDSEGAEIEGGPFNIDVVFTSIPDPIPNIEVGDVSFMDFDFDIGCGETVIGDLDDNELGVFDDPLDQALLNIFQFLNQGYEDNTELITALATETGQPEGTIVEFIGDCDPNPIVIFEEGEPETFQETFETTGLVCLIVNTFPDETSNLLITKECLSGDGDGDVDFNVLVTDELGGALPDGADMLDCDEIMVVSDLAEGTYRIQEFITGPDANLFLTAIVCTTADGQTVTPGQLAEVDIEAGEDAECAIINVFLGAGVVDPGDPGAPPAPPTVIVPIDIDNTNTNTLDNNNTNDNNNVNTNTQEQSNFQEQINDNNQTTTVNSSPSVVIDFDE